MAQSLLPNGAEQGSCLCLDGSASVGSCICSGALEAAAEGLNARPNARYCVHAQKVTVTRVESDNYYHYYDNRVLPTQVTDAKIAEEGGAPRCFVQPACLQFNGICRPIASALDSICRSRISSRLRLPALVTSVLLLPMRAGYWHNPDWIINELNLNSTITSPTHEEVCRCRALHTPCRLVLLHDSLETTKCAFVLRFSAQKLLGAKDLSPVSLICWTQVVTLDTPKDYILRGYAYSSAPSYHRLQPAARIQ